MKEFWHYTWSIMKEDFKASFMPIVAIRNWIIRNGTTE